MTVVTESGYQLELGSVALMENDTYLESGGFKIEALGEGATFGNGVPVSEAVQSLLRDGDLTTTTRYGNRTASFQVRVVANSYQGLADGEALLQGELDKPNSLAWRVPQGAPVTVFDVVRSWSEFVFEDLSETLRLERVFTLSFECLPDGRSETEVSFVWSGSVAEMDPLTSLTGWTYSGTTPTISSGIRTTGTTVLSRSVGPVRDYLWLKVEASSGTAAARRIHTVSVNGMAIPDAEVLQDFAGQSIAPYYTVDVSEWRGEIVTVQFTLAVQGGSSVTLKEFWTTNYPNKAKTGTDHTQPPPGLDVVDIIGTSRAPATLSFTAPAGGAFVYTAPDPNVALRERGFPENVFGVFDVAAAAGATVSVGATVMWFPEGSHHTQIGRTTPQPLQLNPNGVWPQERTQVTTIGGDASASQYAYPADPDAAISFFDTSGAKSTVSPSPTLPTGYSGGAVAHENHVLHPGRCGFAVLDANGAPISTTVTYYPRWKHHAAV